MRWYVKSPEPFSLEGLEIYIVRGHVSVGTERLMSYATCAGGVPFFCRNHE
jgi:hypothetical protein